MVRSKVWVKFLRVVGWVVDCVVFIVVGCGAAVLDVVGQLLVDGFLHLQVWDNAKESKMYIVSGYTSL